jgi:hypothetical protein
MTLATTISATIGLTLVGAADDFGSTPRWALNYNRRISLATGTGTSQADRVFADSRQLAASANEDLDLAGVLTDPLGAVLTFVKVKGIWVKALTGNTNNVIVKPAAAAGFLGPFGDASDTLSIPPNGEILLVAPKAGWAVGAGTTDKLNFANSAGGSVVNYELIIVGTSA